jgi:hypothetical protein
MPASAPRPGPPPRLVPARLRASSRPASAPRPGPPPRLVAHTRATPTPHSSLPSPPFLLLRSRPRALHTVTAERAEGRAGAAPGAVGGGGRGDVASRAGRRPSARRRRVRPRPAGLTGTTWEQQPAATLYHLQHACGERGWGLPISDHDWARGMRLSDSACVQRLLGACSALNPRRVRAAPRRRGSAVPPHLRTPLPRVVAPAAPPRPLRRCAPAPGPGHAHRRRLRGASARCHA